MTDAVFSSDPAPKRMSSESRREVILAAALDEFGRRGYYSTQMEHVAAAAGVSKALIYQHFASKDELFAAVTDQLIAGYAARLPEVLDAAGDALAAWRAAVHLMVDLVGQSPQAWSLVVRHLFDTDAGDPLRDLRGHFTEFFAGLLVAFYDPQPQPGRASPSAEEVRRVAEITVPMLIGGLQGLLTWWVEHPDITSEEIERRAVEFVWLGLDRQRRGEILA